MSLRAQLRRLATIGAAALCAAAILSTRAAAADAELENGVLVLTDDNFATVAAEHDTLLVEFYAPWCGHCKALAPKYEEAAKTLADKSGGVLKIAKFDADAHKAVSGRFGVSSFPTLKLFRAGEFVADYEGERTAEAIVDFVELKAKTAAKLVEVSSLSELKRLVKAKNVEATTIVGFFSNRDGVDFKIFSAVAASLADTGVKAFFTANTDVLEGFGFYSEGSSIQMYRPAAKPFKVTYRGTIFKQSLKDWIVDHAIEGVMPYAKANQRLFQLAPRAMLRVAAKGGEVPAALRAALVEMASASKKKQPADRMHIAVSDIAEFQGEADAHCGKEGAELCAMISDAKGKSVFGEAKPTAASIAAFVKNFNAGELQPRVKSEPVPPVAAPGEVQTIVGASFDEIVTDGDKPVFIKFYAPWCGHCKSLAPKWEELAQALKGESVVIGKFDATENDVPKAAQQHYKVSGFPTLLMKKAGSPTPVSYDGARDVEALKKWVLSQL